MQQQFGEDDGHIPPDELKDVETGIRQMIQSLLQYQSVRLFLLVFGCVLLAAIVQGGLLGPLIIIVVISMMVFLAQGQATIDRIERWTNAPISPFLRKLLVGNPSDVQVDTVAQEQTKVQPFAEIRTLDDLWLLTPSAFEHVVGDVMQHMDYAHVQVVGKSRDLCVDITARGPRGELVAVQCKRYTKRNVNSDEMQKFIGMIYLHHRAEKGMYFTTSSYTKDARKLGEDNHIELIDGQRLIQIICDL